MTNTPALIAQARARLGDCSQRELAHKIGLKSNAVLSRLEAGKDLPSDVTLTKICQEAGVDPTPHVLELLAVKAAEPARTLYLQLLAQLTRGAVTVLLALTLFWPAAAAPSAALPGNLAAAPTMYYGKFRGALGRLVKALTRRRLRPATA